MGVRLSFEETGIVNVVVTGDVDLEEALEAVESLYSDMRFRLPSRILWDVSEGRFDWTLSEIQTFGDFLRRNRPKGPGRAAALVSHERSFELGRMYAMLTDDIPVEAALFRDRDSALKWLHEPS